ncbi:hypothetical protein BCR37DRAFT_380597 [Protomyces lactucae-debilis]|uniref:Uncharacterized protein n=1 Tax=Protomyces lactucae-debilis TaxID=2754530 RepID=A0A1Y2FBJ8_PROLT|nr:uncharacterized protein BCR37DRAFT_380597 [Protomyces lactucae-debilis]ORY80824.1 hypothetical protein BCR37DRAFT_380597 [Protomyces lactucae-debilis]
MGTGRSSWPLYRSCQACIFLTRSMVLKGLLMVANCNCKLKRHPREHTKCSVWFSRKDSCHELPSALSHLVFICIFTSFP